MWTKQLKNLKKKLKKIKAHLKMSGRWVLV